MNRQEIAQRMASAVIDVDKELAAKTHDLNENEIVVNLISGDGEGEEFDVIRSVNEKLVCNDGDFELEELDGFIQRAFGDLLD